MKRTKLLLSLLLLVVVGTLTGCLTAGNFVEDSYELRTTEAVEVIESDGAVEQIEVTEFVEQENVEDIAEVEETDVDSTEKMSETYEIIYEFRNDDYLEQHFEKHKEEFDYATAQEYLEGANRVIADKNALYKTEAEDGDHIYYLEETNEFVVLSTDGYIRTYFKPSAGIDYFNRQ